MKKKFLSMLLGLCMLLTLLPATALATGAASVIVGGVTLNSTDAPVYAINSNGAVTTNGATADNYNVKFVVENGTATLTLKDAAITQNYTNTNTTGSKYGIYTQDDLKIVLVGENTVTAENSDTGGSTGVRANNLTITGSGSLTVVGGAGTGSYGINANNITISGGTVTAVGGKATTDSMAVRSDGAVTISNGAQLTAVGGAGSSSHGIYSSTTTVTVSGNTTKVIAVGGDGASESCGISAQDPIERGAIAYDGGLLVAKGRTKAMSQAATGEALASAAATGTYSGKYYVVSPTTDGTVAYHVVDGNVTNATEDMAGHLEWTDANNDTTKETLTLTDTIIIGKDKDQTDGIQYASALAMPRNSTLTLNGFNVVLAGDSNEWDSYAVNCTASENTDNNVLGESRDTINGDGALIAIGGTAAGHSAGVHASWELAVTGSVKITAIAGAAGDNSAGFDAAGYDMNGENVDITAIGGVGNTYGLGLHQNSSHYNAKLFCKGTAIAGSSSDASKSQAAFFHSDSVLTGAALTAGAWNGKAAIWSPAAERPVITTDLSPTGVTYGYGASPEALEIKISISDSGVGTLSLQWYSNTENSTTGGTEIPDATHANYAPDTTRVGTTYYYCVVTNTKGTQTATTTSSIAKVTVNAWPASVKVNGSVELGAATPYWKNGESGATADATDYNAYYNSATGVLTLKNAKIQTISEYAIQMGGTVKIVLEGENTVASTGSAASTSCGIGGSNVVIEGGGSLTVTGGGGENVSESWGISATNLTVKGGTVIAKANQKALNLSGAFSLNGVEVVTASTNTDGSDPVTYASTDLNTYKYLKTEPSAVTYTVTFGANGGSGEMAAQTITANQATALPLNTFTREGYVFTGWNTAADGSGTAYADGAHITLTEAITLYAQWTAITPPSGGGDTYTPPTYDVPVTGGANTVEVSATVSGSTATIQNITERNINAAAGTEGEAQAIVVDLTGLEKEIDQVKLTGSTVSNLAKAANDPDSSVTGVTIKLSGAEVTLDAALLTTLAEQTDGGGLLLNVDEEQSSNLNDAQKAAVANMTNPKIMDAYFTVSGQRIRDFKGGTALVTVPYERQGNGAVFAIYVDENGERTAIRAEYDPVKKLASFIAPHFSYYVVTETGVCLRDDACPAYRFTDLDLDLWYHDGIHYCVEHGLISGYPGDRFGPDDATSRAMLVTILWRLEGSPIVENAMTFADVAESSYYSKAVQWAAGLGIAGGYGNGRFGPDDVITREQMAAILWRYAKYKGVDVSAGENTGILSYEDAAKVSEWATSAMQWANGFGIIQGSDNRLMPKNGATRAHAAAMIQRFCELTDQA